MNDPSLDRAILNLRAEILIRKLIQYNKYLSVKDAKVFVKNYSDMEAFEQCMKEFTNPLSSWAKQRWYSVLRILQK